MKAGPKFTYDVKKFDDIVDSVVKAKGSLGQIADLNEIPRTTFYEWLRQGDEDRKNGLRTDIGQLACRLRKAQADVVMNLCEVALKNEKKSKFIMWWLSRICREDFGIEGPEIKELKDLFKVIMPLIGKGDLINGCQKSEERREEIEEKTEIQC